jgi:hypothetical protein
MRLIPTKNNQDLEPEISLKYSFVFHYYSGNFKAEFEIPR